MGITVDNIVQCLSETKWKVHREESESYVFVIVETKNYKNSHGGCRLLICIEPYSNGSGVRVVSPAAGQGERMRGPVVPDRQRRLPFRS